MMNRVYIVVFLLLTCLVPLAAQTLPQRDLESHIGSDVMGLEAWEESEADYVAYDVPLMEGGVDLADVKMDDVPCAGITTIEPTYHIDWVRDAIDEEIVLRLFFVGSTDTTLAVQEPDGDWVCADNWDDTIHPLIDFTQMRTGRYAVWVGVASGTGSGRLVTTIGDYTPLQPPPVALEFQSLFQGSGSTTAHITYIEVDENPEDQTLDISVDLVLIGKNRDQFRVWVTLMDAATDTPLAAGAGDPQDETGALAASKDIRLTGTYARYDYGQKSKGAVEIQLPLSALVPGQDVYPLIRVEQLSRDMVGEEILSYAAVETVYTP